MKKLRWYSVIIVCFLAGLFLNSQRISGDAKEDTKQATVRIGYYNSQFLYEKKGELFGYGYEFYQSLARRLNWKTEYVKGTYTECIQRLEEGKIDLMAPLPIEEETNGKVFMKSLGEIDMVLVAESTSDYNLNQLQEKENVQVGYLNGVGPNEIYVQYYKSQGIHVKRIGYNSCEELEQALESGKIDIAERSVFDTTVEDRIIAHIGSKEYHIGVTGQRSELFVQMNNELLQMEEQIDGYLVGLLNKYYPNREYCEFYLTDSEEAYLKKKKKLTVVIPNEQKPLHYYGKEESKLYGINGEIIELLSQKLGIAIECIQANSNSEYYSLLKENKVDLLAGIRDDYSYVKEFGISLSIPYLEDEIVFVTKRDHEFDKSGVTAITGGEVTLPELKNNQQKSYKDLEQCLVALRKGEVDITYGNREAVEYYLSKNHWSDLIQINYETVQYSFCLGYVNDDSRLCSVIDRALNSIDRTTKSALKSKTINSSEEYTGVTKILYDNPITFIVVILISAVVVILGTIVLLKFKLRREVRRIHSMSDEGERYRVAAELSDDILFEYEIATDIMKYSDKYRDVFGRNTMIYNYTELLPELAYIPLEDRAIFREYCKQLHLGKSTIELEYRCMNDLEEYLWCHVHCKTINNMRNYPERVIGKLVNIDMQKRELQKLQIKAQRDPLTNALNKGATIEQINTILSQSKGYEKHVLFVVDIDNFKHVNDTYGHLVGDKVISTVVGHMRTLFRDKDVVGRIGGDEFVAFMTNVTNQEQILKKAEMLRGAFSHVYVCEQGKFQVSGSIGIAISPMDGKEYNILLKHADEALYQVKNKGKNNYQLYNEIK